MQKNGLKEDFVRFRKVASHMDSAEAQISGNLWQVIPYLNSINSVFEMSGTRKSLFILSINKSNCRTNYDYQLTNKC